MTQDLPPRATDILRHLSDLRTGTYEGAAQWADRVRVFRQAVTAVPIPTHLSRRTSGPWPAAEFLSEQVKMPQVTGAK